MQAPPWYEVDLRLDDEDSAQPVADLLGQRGVGGRAGGELDGDRKRRLLLDACRLRPHEDVTADLRAEGADDLAHRGREDVHAADDQHVVRTPDAAHTWAGAPARTRAH